MKQWFCIKCLKDVTSDDIWDNRFCPHCYSRIKVIKYLDYFDCEKCNGTGHLPITRVDDKFRNKLNNPYSNLDFYQPVFKNIINKRLETNETKYCNSCSGNGKISKELFKFRGVDFIEV